MVLHCTIDLTRSGKSTGCYGKSTFSTSCLLTLRLLNSQVKSAMFHNNVDLSKGIYSNPEKLQSVKIS